MSKKYKNLRDSKEYKKMDNYLATAIAEGFCEGEGASKHEQLCAWQYLHDTKMAYSLQGWFGRACRDLVDRGLIDA